MLIYDINTAIGEPLVHWRFTSINSLIQAMDDYRISKALTYHALADRDPETGNTLMLTAASEHADRIHPCLLLEPSKDTLGIPGTGSIHDRLAASGVTAVRVVYGASTHYYMDKFYSRDLLQPLEEMHMPLILDGDNSRQFFSALPDMALAYPHVPMIILRYGLNESRTIMPLLKYTPNVYFDMSTMLDCGQLEEITEKFGSERLLFGSALPYYVPSGPLGLLLYSGISEEARENIAHANFERLEGGIRK